MLEEPSNNQQPEEQRLLFLMAQYKGEFSLQNLVFNANLQEFAQRVSYIHALHSENEITNSDAYYLIEQIWEELTRSKKELDI